MKNFLMHRAAGDPADPGTKTPTSLRAGMALLAAAGLLLGPAVVALPASAEDPTATDPAVTETTVIDAGNQPLGVAAAPDGTVYVANILRNDVAVIEPGGTTVARRIPVGAAPQEVVATPDSAVYVTARTTRSRSSRRGPRPRRRRFPPVRTPAVWRSGPTAPWWWSTGAAGP